MGFPQVNKPAADITLCPGEQLRGLRTRLAVTTREVEEYSRVIAQAHSNDEFYISNAWLTQLENTDSIPRAVSQFSKLKNYHSEHLQAFQPQRNLQDEIHGFVSDFRRRFER